MSGRRRKHQPAIRETYSWVTELMARPDAPLPERDRTHHVTVILQALRSLERDEAPSTDDWRLCSDAVNMMETLCTHAGWTDATGAPVLFSDASGLLMDAITALALASKRHRKGGPIRLSGEGIQAVRAIVEDYAGMLEQLSARSIIRAHRLTERRLRAILSGRSRPHDVEVVDL